MPVFNTLFHSEELSSELAYAALLPALMLNQLHYTGQIVKAELPKDFETAYQFLNQSFRRTTGMLDRRSRWEGVFNDFINQANRYLTLTDEAPLPSSLHYRFLSSHKTAIGEHFERSKEMLSVCLSLLYAIKTHRLAWKKELVVYLTTVNHFVTEQITAPAVSASGLRRQSPLASLKCLLQNAVAVDQEFIQSPSGRVASTQRRGKTKISFAEQRLAELKIKRKKTTLEEQEEQGLFSDIARQDQVVKAYPSAQRAVDDQLKLDEGTHTWLTQFARQFPTAVFTLDDCFNINFTDIAESAPILKLPSKEEVEAAAAAKCPAPEPRWAFEEVKVTMAPWLYSFANVHLVSEDRVAAYEALLIQFSLTEPVQPMCKLLTQIQVIVGDIYIENIKKVLQAPITKATGLLGRINQHTRPLNFYQSKPVAESASHLAVFKSAYDLVGAKKARGWLNTSIAFSCFRRNLCDQLFHYVSDLRNNLAKELKNPIGPYELFPEDPTFRITNVDFRGNDWLGNLLRPLYVHDIELNIICDPNVQTIPENRKILVEQLKEVIQLAQAIYDAAHDLKNIVQPIGKISQDEQFELYRFLVRATNGMKWGHAKETSPDELIDLTKNPFLKFDRQFTPPTIKICSILFGAKKIEDALSALWEANQDVKKSRPDAYLLGLHQYSRRLIETTGTLYENVTDIFLEIGRLATYYLPQLMKENSPPAAAAAAAASHTDAHHKFG